MQRQALFLTFAALASAMRIPKTETPNWVCDVKSELPAVANFLVATNDAQKQAETTENTNIDARVKKLRSAKKDVPAEDKAEYEAAKAEMMEIMTKVQAAKVRFNNAVDNMLQVPSMDGNKLTALLEKKEKDTLVVFYAPWCGHCQQFVMFDGEGNPEKSPLEQFNKEMSKTYNIVRYDIQKNRDSLPKDFDVQYIPTVYMVSADGQKTRFEGDPKNLDGLKAFMEQHSSAKKAEKK